MARSRTRDRAGFMWYPSYTDAFRNERLDAGMRESLLFAMFDFVEDQEYEPELAYPLDMAFDCIRPNLEQSLENFKNGKKGGRPKKEHDDANPPFNPPFNHAEKQGNERKGNVIKENSASTPPPSSEGGVLAACPKCGSENINVASGYCLDCHHRWNPNAKRRA